MKAIVNVSKFNQYSKLNLQTFEVVELLSTIICLDINGTKIDFSHKEVILIDIAELYKIHCMYINRASKPSEFRFKTNLNSYMKINKIILP